MKQIFLKIQQQLAAEVTDLRHIDRNWGQMNYEQPPVQFPCALIDVESIAYSELSDGGQQAQATVSVSVCEQVLVRSSSQAPAPSGAYAVVDTVERVHRALQGYACREAGSEFQPLSLERMEHQYTDRSFDIYKLTFTTAFIVRHADGSGPNAPQPHTARIVPAGG